jgi:hypothetical protein
LQVGKGRSGLAEWGLPVWRRAVPVFFWSKWFIEMRQ